MDIVSLNTIFGGEVSEGQKIDYMVEIPKEDRYVVNTGGKANVTIEIWQKNENIFCMTGVAQKAALFLKSGDCKIVTNAVSNGNFTIEIRKWVFWDNFGFHR